MNKAVIIHGTDSSPSSNWFPWLKDKLEASNYTVWVPEMPNSHTPDSRVYGDFLFNSNWDFTDNILIGHSSGAVEVLNMLMDERCPHVKLAVLVGAWKGGVPNGYDNNTHQFDNLFPANGFDFDTIKQKADQIEFIHGGDDPYCPLDQAEYLAAQTDAHITVIEHGHHLGERFKELPQLWERLSL